MQPDIAYALDNLIDLFDQGLSYSTIVLAKSTVSHIVSHHTQNPSVTRWKKSIRPEIPKPNLAPV